MDRFSGESASAGPAGKPQELLERLSKLEETGEPDEGRHPDLCVGVGVNMEPLQKAGS
jgi:hypothetical protein